MKQLSTLVATGLALSAIGTLAAQDATADQVRSWIEAAGYTNVQDIRREGDHFDAKATKDGQQVSLDVDARTGVVTLEEDEEEGEEDDE
jgi:hypothetical protein